MLYGCSTKLKTSKMQTVMRRAGWGQELKSPERLGPERLSLSAACTQHPGSVGKEGSQGSLESEAGQNGERKAESSYIAPGLQPFRLKQQGLCLGFPGTAPDNHKWHARFGESKAYEPRASVHISTPHHCWTLEKPASERTELPFAP